VLAVTAAVVLAVIRMVLPAKQIQVAAAAARDATIQPAAAVVAQVAAALSESATQAQRLAL
jgi:hypothetical protein